MNPDLLQALVAESAHNVPGVVDLLLNLEVPLADVLLGCCGSPPDWDDGLPQEVLAEWLARQVPADERSERLQKAWVQQGSGKQLWWSNFDGDDVATHWWYTEAAARRYLKRRVLSLFGEVSHTFEAGIPADGWIGQLMSQAFPQFRPELDRHPIRWDAVRDVFRQTLPAPEWVPPHDEERARIGPVAPWEPLRGRLFGDTPLSLPTSEQT